MDDRNKNPYAPGKRIKKLEVRCIIWAVQKKAIYNSETHTKQ